MRWGSWIWRRCERRRPDRPRSLSQFRPHRLDLLHQHRDDLGQLQACVLGFAPPIGKGPSLIIVMAAVVFLAIGRADHYIKRVSHAYRQLETITSLSLHANRYSEQIAEMLLFGESGRIEFEEARRDLVASFAALHEVTMRELDFIDDPVERETERQELAR